MSFVRIAASAAVFTLLSAVSATAKPVAISTDTNLRKSPGTNSDVVTLIPKGTTVEVGKCIDGWCAASLNGQDGYVIAQNVGMAPRRPPRGRVIGEEEVIEDDGPPVTYGRPYYGPPVYYGYGPYYGYGYGWGGWGYRGGWGRRW